MAGPFSDATDFGSAAPSDGALMSDLKAFTVNVDKLHGALSHSRDREVKIDAFGNHSSVSNPFLSSNAFGESPKQSSPMKSTINYDAFRDTFTANDVHEPILPEAQLPTKPAISMDLFKDAATAAFNEFGASNHRKHEFFNKMPELVSQSGKVMFN